MQCQRLVATLDLHHNLVADLSAKLLREKIVEAGRVSFPAVLRHNYNLLFQAVRTPATAVIPVGEIEEPPKKAEPVIEPAESQDTPPAGTKPEKPAAKPLKIVPYGKAPKKL